MRTVRIGSQQVRVKPRVDRVFEYKNGAAESDQRKPHTEADTEPAVDGEPFRARPHASPPSIAELAEPRIL